MLSCSAIVTDAGQIIRTERSGKIGSETARKEFDGKLCHALQMLTDSSRPMRTDGTKPTKREISV